MINLTGNATSGVALHASKHFDFEALPPTVRKTMIQANAKVKEVQITASSRKTMINGLTVPEVDALFAQAKISGIPAMEAKFALASAGIMRSIRNV